MRSVFLIHDTDVIYWELEYRDQANVIQEHAERQGNRVPGSKEAMDMVRLACAHPMYQVWIIWLIEAPVGEIDFLRSFLLASRGEFVRKDCQVEKYRNPGHNIKVFLSYVTH